MMYAGGRDYCQKVKNEVMIVQGFRKIHAEMHEIVDTAVAGAMGNRDYMQPFGGLKRLTGRWAQLEAGMIKKLCGDKEFIAST